MGSLKQCAEADQKMKFLFCVKYFNWNPAENGLYVTLELENSEVHDKLPDLTDWFIDYSVGIQRNEDEGFNVINTELGKVMHLQKIICIACTLCRISTLCSMGC